MSTPFRDAEAWLAERGVRREPLVARPEAPAEAEEGPAERAPAEPAAGDQEPAVTATHAVRLAQAAADEQLRRVDEAAADHSGDAPRLDDQVADAVAYVRRSTASSPQAKARVARRLRERDWPEVVVTRAMERAAAQGLVDDAAMATALVREGRAKGHAPRRLRHDLQRRELEAEAIEQALAELDDRDPEAVAFEIARKRAESLTGISAEAAFRRVVGYLARRGHPEGLARKVAREAVFTTRDEQRAADR